MDPGAMGPFGLALLAYLEGDARAELVVRRDDGLEAVIPARVFFRDEPDFTDLERTAVARCTGRVLDIGAGAGSHSAALQRLGLRVTAIDASSRAVEVMSRRGVGDARCEDIFTFDGGPFDTLLMLGHGLGMVETIGGLRRFLDRARGLLTVNGQLLADSLDVRVTTDAAHLAYHDANERAGRYRGEIRMQFEFRGLRGPFCGWLQVDADTLRAHAEATGWQCEIACRGSGGDYLARLTKRDVA